VATAPEFFSKISNASVSWINGRHRKQEGTPKNKYEDDQFAGINRRVPGQYRWKGDQWVLLSRRHASKIIEIDRPHIAPKHQLWQSFRDINASDEMFIPTALAILGYLRYTNDGDDTQRGRSVVPNEDPRGGAGRGSGPPSSSGPTPPAAAAAASEKSNASKKGCSSDGTASEAPLNKNECIFLRPVTYTDWSEGMKNPATFCNGTKDLKRVGKLAREKGCLVARKFATHINVPGVPMDEQKITGEISAEEWLSIIFELQQEGAVAGGHNDVGSRQEDTAARHGEGKDEHLTNDKDKDVYQEEESKLPPNIESAQEEQDEQGNEDDDDQEENQL
jgi:hypothetical protein